MRGMSNKTLKGASRDKDVKGVPSSGNGRIKDWGPSEQPGSAPRELGTRDQLASLGKLTIFGPRGRGRVASSR